MKYIQLKLTDDLHRKIKVQAAIAEKTMPNYVLACVRVMGSTFLHPSGVYKVKQPQQEECLEEGCKNEPFSKTHCKDHQVVVFKPKEEPEEISDIELNNQYIKEYNDIVTSGIDKVIIGEPQQEECYKCYICKKPYDPVKSVIFRDEQGRANHIKCKPKDL